MKTVPGFLAASLISVSLSAQAQTAAGIIERPMPLNTVSFELSLEDWVQTDTARVVIAMDAALPGSDAGKVRSDMLKAVQSLASDGQWKFSSFDHSVDPSGLEHWHAELESRLKETELGGLADKAKQASKPGLQLKVDQTDFTPTLAETEAVKAKLRQQIYNEVNDELKRLQTAEPDQKFRVSSISFDVGPLQPRPAMMMKAMAVPADAPDDGSPVTVAQKVEVKARIVLAAPSQP